jgi:hypothetical protein
VSKFGLLSDLVESEIDERIEKAKLTITSLPIQKVEENFLIPKILIIQDEILDTIYSEIIKQLEIISKETIRINEEIQNDFKNFINEKKDEFKKLKFESHTLISNIKEKLALQKKMISLREEENELESHFNIEILNMTEKLDREILNNKRIADYKILNEEIFLLPREHFLRLIKK